MIIWKIEISKIENSKNQISKIEIWSERKKLLDSWQETLTCSYHSRPISSLSCFPKTVFNFFKEKLLQGYVEVGCWEVILELKPSLHATIWATSWMVQLYFSWQVFFRQHFIISSIAKKSHCLMFHAHVSLFFCSMSRLHKIKLIADWHCWILIHKINKISRWNWLIDGTAPDKSQHVSLLLIVCPTFGSHVLSVNSQLENGAEGGGGGCRTDWNWDGFIGTTRQFPPSQDQTLPKLADHVC